MIAVSIALTAGSTSVGEFAARRSSRRTAADSAATGEWSPLTASCASRRSAAIFSPCIITVRRFGERGLLAILRRERLQFVGSMAQIVRFALGALHAGAVLLKRAVGRAARLPQLLQRRDIFLQAGKGIEQAPMRGGIDQRALVMLAVNLDQRAADRFQRLHRDRLVVDEGAGAAIGELHAAQDHFTGVVEAVVGEDRGRRMPLRHIEHGDDLALLRAVAHQAGVAAAAERQRKGIEQDRFARAGFAGQYRQPFGEFDIEPLDQDDVADRQTRQHKRINPSRDLSS